MYANHVQDERSLIARLNDGDVAALSEIYEAYWYKLYQSAWALARCKEIAEDAVQEIFINLWNARGHINISNSLNSYLHASVRFQVLRSIKGQKLYEDVFDELYHHLQTTPALQDLELRELQAQIGNIVEQLPPQCKTVYKLSREEHLTHKQIAEHLNISTKAVEKHLTKALRVLRVNLKHVAAVELFLLLLKK